VNSDNRVSLRGHAVGSNYASYRPLEWIYRAHRIGERGWFTAPGLAFGETLTVDADGTFEARFRSQPVRTEGMVYRLDFEWDTNDHKDRYRALRVAYYNDRTMTAEDCPL
jgi:hypothetical protein